MRPLSPVCTADRPKPPEGRALRMNTAMQAAIRSFTDTALMYSLTSRIRVRVWVRSDISRSWLGRRLDFRKKASLASM